MASMVPRPALVNGNYQRLIFDYSAFSTNKSVSGDFNMLNESMNYVAHYMGSK